jgi:hypothetical protein
LTSKPIPRIVAFIVIAAAVLAGLASRVVFPNPRAGGIWFAGIASMDLRVGQALGDGTFDGVEQEPIPALRLRTKLCSEPVFAVPLRLSAVAITQVADASYLRLGGYRSTDVYSANVRKNFSHLDRLLARAMLETADGFFVRFYAPSHCEIGDDAYVAMANAILNFGSIPEKAAEAKAPTLVFAASSVSVSQNSRIFGQKSPFQIS